MAELFKRISTGLPGPDLERFLDRSRIDVVMPFYHAVSDQSLPHLARLYPVRSVSQFKEDLEFLLARFEPVSLEEFLGNRFSGHWKKMPMVMSFDDGLVQCYDEVQNILYSKGIPAVFFVNNAFIDNKGMFYRFRVCLLLEKYPNTSNTEKKKAAEILKCSLNDLPARLNAVSYLEREFTDQIAEAWSYSFSEYMRIRPVYMSSIQIKRLISKGFEVGSHGIDHPLFSVLKQETTINHIQRSIADLSRRFKIDYKYFAFPFTDFGVEDATIAQLFNEQIIDAGFGTAGLKHDIWKSYFQRIPMERYGMSALRIIRGEINRYRVRGVFGKNLTKRK